MENVLKENKWLKILQNVSKIINYEKTDEYISDDITEDDISHYI